MMNTTKTVTIHKMHGCGNDFVLIDNRELNIPEENMAEWARKICPRGFGAGADGLIFIDLVEEEPSAAYKWSFFNADGSRAEMCGNASRCMGKLGLELGLAGEEHAFLTDAGLISVRILPKGNLVKSQLTAPQDLDMGVELDIDGQDLNVNFVNTGVPHAVSIFQEVDNINVQKLGAGVRYHSHFQPAGTNANFIQVVDRNSIKLRTYERGVEAETYACGTGAAAAAIITKELGLTDTVVEVTTSGGELLTVSLENGSVYLTGKAIKVYTGELDLESVGLTLP